MEGFAHPGHGVGMDAGYTGMLDLLAQPGHGGVGVAVLQEVTMELGGTGG